MSDRESFGNLRAGARLIQRSAAYRLSWQVAALIVILALPVAGQDAASEIKAEAERFQRSLKDKPVFYPGVPNANAMVGDLLKAALQAQSAGRLYLSLEELSQIADFIHGAWTAVDKAEAVKSGLPAFEAEWEKMSSSVTALDRQARERNWNDAGAVVQAMSETAQGKTIPLLEGGRGFAVSTEPKDGLFHLGEAQGEAEFAAFCASLHFPRKGAPYPLRSFLPELEGLQKKTNAAFQPPRSIELHERFMALNSALKLAQELDASKFYAGALYQYLEAVLQYGMLDAVSLDASQQTALKGALAGTRQKLAASRRDDSIAELFLERAESQVAHADASTPSADDWRSAKVILDQVLPAYYATEKPPAAMERAANQTVEITLVRWPYT